MALTSSRQDLSRIPNVKPDRGIFVEADGIMEIRTTSEDVYFKDQPVDMKDFQARITSIPDDFCTKNRSTTEQRFFFCIVCDCDLKGPRPLMDHVKGNTHIR